MTLFDIPETTLADDLPTRRLLNGMWQVSGGHGRIDPKAAVAEMYAYHDAGYTTWDLADHYGPAEDLIGRFRHELQQRRGEAALAEMQAFTKWVPRPGPMTRAVVDTAVSTSRQRMGMETLDLLQFHWWDYGDRRYLDALRHLAALRDDGQIRHLALTNFDTQRVREITEAGIRIVANQVQYSLIDRRPAQAMAPYCTEQGIGLLTYGTFCGGFLSEAWLGRPEPSRWQLETVSQRKYKQMIDAWGGWALFQELLRALQAIAQKHGVSVANVAVRAILEQTAVAGVIVGVRLGLSEHRADNARVFDFTLDEADWADINASSSRANDLMAVIGDCGDEYR